MSAKKSIIQRLLRSESGIAAVEFALSMPFLLVLSLVGAETANLAMVHLKISQVTVQLADNASRIGDTSMLTNRKIYERDINDLLVGANIQGGSINFYEHGRAIISSLEVDGLNRQYIHWQRCMGKRVVGSAFGGQGAIVPNGLGPPGEEVQAIPGEAVIFVEVTYDYKPLFAGIFGPTTITAVESFTVRSSRDLSGAGIFQQAPLSPDPVASCFVYNGLPNIAI
jgi:hypothetical protein